MCKQLHTEAVSKWGVQKDVVALQTEHKQQVFLAMPSLNRSDPSFYSTANLKTPQNTESVGQPVNLATVF